MSPPVILIRARVVLASSVLLAYAVDGSGCGEDMYFNGTDCVSCAVGYRVNFPADCNGGLCVTYNDYFYRTLDGTPPSTSVKGCQTTYMSLPAGWEIAGWNDDSRHVASSYIWGTNVIALGYGNGQAEWTVEFDHVCSSCHIDVSTASYKPNTCDLRILIRKASVCVPTLQAVLWEREPQTVRATMLEEDGLENVVKLIVNVKELPTEVYGNVSVWYRIDIAITEAALNPISSCSELWTQSSATEFFITVSSASGDCPFNQTIDGNHAEWSALLAVYIMADVADGGVASPPYVVPVDLMIDRAVGQVYQGGGGWSFSTIYAGNQSIYLDGPTSTLNIFSTSGYVNPMKEAFFTEGEDIFVWHNLENTGLGFTVEVVLVWLATSANPHNQVGLVRDLTAEVGTVEGDGGVKYSFKANGDGCLAGCWLHSLCRVTDGSTRRLEVKTVTVGGADSGDSYSNAVASLTIALLTTPPDGEGAAAPKLQKYRDPGVIIVAAVGVAGVANALAWPTLLYILHCRDTTPLDLPPEQQRYRILSDHALKVVLMDLLRLVLGVASFVLAWHFEELDATSDPDIMLRGLLAFTAFGGLLFIVEAAVWMLWARCGRGSSFQKPKGIIVLACLYLLVADAPAVVIYAGVALFGWLDGSFPWVSTLGAAFAVLFVVVKFAAVSLAARAAERAARNAQCDTASS